MADCMDFTAMSVPGHSHNLHVLVYLDCAV